MGKLQLINRNIYTHAYTRKSNTSITCQHTRKQVNERTQTNKQEKPSTYRYNERKKDDTLPCVLLALGMSLIVWLLFWFAMMNTSHITKSTNKASASLLFLLLQSITLLFYSLAGEAASVILMDRSFDNTVWCWYFTN
mmetsp:Transcript_14139/g.18433  ORF Transcript_14139/g.18433 Transcript_14139/m.18433 type:complete len:138 (-) Transcript_14139:86-499(-)